MFEHAPHPHTTARLAGTAPPAPKTAHERTGLNGRIGLAITAMVGTMAAAYVFAAIALLSLPDAIRSHNLVILVAWVSSNFLQLVLLPVIIVGQNIQARAADKRADATYTDAEAVLHECLQIQAHLAAQDAAVEHLVASLRTREG